MLEQKQTTLDEALNKLSLVADSLLHLGQAEASPLGSLLQLLGHDINDCVAALDTQESER